MEDFIIILIGFAVMLYSAYSKNKKAKKQQARQGDSTDAYENKPGETSSQEGTDFIEQLFGYDSEKTEHPFADESVSGKRETFQDTSDIHKQNMQRDVLNHTHKSDPYSASEARTDNKKSSLPEEGIRATKRNRYKKSTSQFQKRKKTKRFDLRSAVIYSEILNRKY